MAVTKNIAFVGGGTGGHITPIVSLIKFMEQDSKIRSKCNKIFWFGEKGSMEEDYAQKIDDVVFLPISAGKWRRYFSLGSLISNLTDLWKALDGLLEAVQLLKKHKIKLVFCKGGYVSLPVCLAARFLQIHIVVHESDTVPGLTNKVVGRLSTVKFGGFPKNLGRDTIYTGQILSTDLLDFEESHFNVELAEIPQDKTLIMVMGGSQGARAIYDALLSSLHDGEYTDVHFLIVLGTKNQEYEPSFGRYQNVTTFDYLSSRSIGYIYSLSDLVITRGGATSLAEQDLFKLFKIIIPTPYTGGNHQFHNAQRYEKNRGDKVVVQSPYLKKDIEHILLDYQNFKKSPVYPNTDMIYEAHSKIFECISVLLK